MEKQQLIQQIELGLSTWGLSKYFNTTQPNIRYWLKKYNLKTQRSKNKAINHRQCLSCNLSKPQEEFYKRGKKYMSHCKTCYQKNYTDISRKNKQKAVDYLGGKCSKCGYNKCNAALDFHHKNSSEKEYGLSNLMKFTNFNKIKTELDKCVLLCANCHREEHHLLKQTF